MKMLFAIDGELQRKVSLSFCLVDFDVQRWKKKYKKGDEKHQRQQQITVPCGGRLSGGAELGVILINKAKSSKEKRWKGKFEKVTPTKKKADESEGKMKSGLGVAVVFFHLLLCSFFSSLHWFNIRSSSLRGESWELQARIFIFSVQPTQAEPENRLIWIWIIFHPLWFS